MMSSPPISDVIARDILEGRCVLVLGPNAFMADKGDGDLRPIHEVVLNIVARKYGVEGDVFSFEEILSKMKKLTENSGHFLKLQMDIARTIRELESSVTLSPLSDKIARLPFTLILNAGPDNLLTDVFARLAIPFYNAFYDFNTAELLPNDEIEFGEQFPTLVYSLYGSVMKPESLVFTSRNQDRYEKAIIRHGLPRSIKRELLRNDTFVFLGFDGKDWTTRQTHETLFSENSESNRQRKIAVGPETSVSYSFGGDFYPMEINEFVDEVFERCLEFDPDFIKKQSKATLAIRRIRDNIEKYGRGEDATILDLSRCDLVEIPIEIIACEWVTTLILTENKQLENIYAISGLLKLQNLDISFTKVADLSPLSDLINLQELLCNFNSISDLSPLSGLTNLKTLKCYNTQVADLSPLSGLSNLEVLNCSSTPVKDLSPLLPLIEMGRRITLNGFTDKGVFDFKDCPLENPPIEVVRQGNEAILKYLGERQYFSTAPVEQSAPRRRYPGLKPFEAADQNVFFGRAREVEQLVSTVLRERVTTLFGPAGVGKTSLLHAGCAPLWLRERFAPIFLRVSPSDKSLADSIVDQLKQSPFVVTGKAQKIGPSNPTLWEKINEMQFAINGSPATPVLIFDQFEEVFAYPEAYRSLLIRELSSIANETSADSSKRFYEANPEAQQENPIDLSMVFSIRSHFLEQMEELSSQIPSISRNRIELSASIPLEAARDAITRPAMIEGFFGSPPFGYSEAALDEISDFLRVGRGSKSLRGILHYQLQLVCQHVETQIIEQGMQEGFMVSREFYGGWEGLERILTDPYKSAMAELSHEEQEIAARMLEDELISSDNRRLSVEDEELFLGQSVSPILLKKLVDSGLLRHELRQGGWYYEISHDALLPIIIQNRDKRKQAASQAKSEIEERERQKQMAEATLLFRFSAPGPKYLLAIEGGDSEVLGQLALLAAFEEKMRNKTGNSRYRISDSFDLIGGAGLGNVVAVQLSLGESIGHLLEDYELEKGSHALLTAGQTLAIKYAEESIAPNWKTGFCYLKSAAYSWSPPLTNHPAKALSLSDTLVEFGSEERDNAAEGISKEWLYGSTKSTLLQISTRSDYPFGWPIGEENLCILSIERSTIVVPPDLRPEKGAIWQGLPTPPTEYRIKQLADWIFESNQKKSPLGFQPCNLKQLSLPLKEAPDKLDFKDWGWLYALAMRELESFDLTPFLPKTTV